MSIAEDKMLLMVTFLLAIFMFSQCEVKNTPVNGLNNVSEEYLEGLELTKIYCYACHNPRAATHDDILAPPLVAVKYRYLKSFPEKEEFVESLSEFVTNPKMELALMKRPVEKFGLMQAIPIEDAQMERIAVYIFDYEVEEPDWFADHFEEEHGVPWNGQ